jgi:hypothetical protein
MKNAAGKTHGVDCPKVQHGLPQNFSYMHAPEYDGPYKIRDVEPLLKAVKDIAVNRIDLKWGASYVARIALSYNPESLIYCGRCHDWLPDEEYYAGASDLVREEEGVE